MESRRPCERDLHNPREFDLAQGQKDKISGKLNLAGGADTDVGAPMIDLTDTRTLLILGTGALVLAGLIGVISAVILARREQARRGELVAVSEVTRDWEPTWKINAVTDAWVMDSEKDDIPSNFVLRIEENRMVRDIGGGEVMEIRWRPPTKAEVREIVRCYHEAQFKAVPIDVIEFERQLTAHTNDHADTDRVDGEVTERPAAAA
jgi:hypothetical protein